MPDLPPNVGNTADWHGCYRSGWKGLIHPDAFAHPAKFSRGLIRRIYAHGLERGYWRKGDLVGDPFGGIGTGGIMAARAGLRWVGVELEPRFVELAKRGPCWDERTMTLICGDSRRFAELVGAVDGAVTSPPYADAIGNTNGIDYSKARGKKDGLKPSTARDTIGGSYGSTPGQIGALRAGTLDGAVTSPPYISGGHHPDQTGAWNMNGRGQGGTREQANYGETDGQIGRLPPGDLDGIATSPPWENQLNNHDKVFVPPKATPGVYQADYGDTVGQLGTTTGDTYWHAVAEVYAQCLIALKPGGVMAVVVKDYVKNKQRVPLSDQTWELLARVGFTPIERVRAMLVADEVMLTGDVKRTERKSFFRRLAEKKGSPPIDHEDVLFLRAACPPPPGALGFDTGDAP